VTSGRRAVAVIAAGLVAAVMSFVLSASAADNGSLPTELELAALTKPRARSGLGAERIYFVMTDRFANGDRLNDRGGLSGQKSVTGFDPADSGYFHGGDLAGLTEKLPYVKRLGMSAVWVTPPVAQRTVQGASAGYHGYWGIDFTKIDPHLGDREAFRRFVDRAHSLDLKVYLDVVVNHTGDVISFRDAGAAGAPYVDQATTPYRDIDGNAFDPASVAGNAAFPEIAPDKRTFPYEPVIAKADANVKQPDWLNDVRNYHNRGDSTFNGESTTYGDFFGLDDLFTERPEVVQGEIELWASWIRDFHVDGFRLDTFKHVSPAFWRAFLPAIQSAARDAGIPDFSVFGEVFDQAATAAAVRRTGVQSVIDFSFQSTVLPFAAGIGEASDLSALFDQDDLYTTATSSANNLATFLGNHDLGRVGFTLLGAASGAAPKALRADLFAHELLFLLRGAPVVYYGDEVGMTGSGDGKDKAARQDMFATAVPEWRVERRLGAPPVRGKPAFDLRHPLARRIAALGTLVERYPALRDGAQIPRFAGRNQAAGVFAVSRLDPKERVEYIVAFNNGAQARSVLVTTSTPNTRFAALWPAVGRGASSDQLGRLLVRVLPNRAAVLRARRQLAPAPSPGATLDAPSFDVTAGLLRLAANVPGTDLGSVTFAFRSEGTDGWVALGTDAARPYRLFAEPGRFKRGRKISVVAIVRTTSGAIAVSAPASFTRMLAG
jgi:glycosidase